MNVSRRWALPAAVLIMGLIATLVASLALAGAERGRDEARFSRLADGAVAAIESRMLAQRTLLRGAAGFFDASDVVDREDFRAYVDRLRLQRFYPGVLGIGYAAYARDKAVLDRIVESARADNAPDFAFNPPGERPDYSTIVFLEPMNRRNREALGFDMMSEPTRRAAMEASRDRGHAVMSGIVRLVQEIDPVKQPGFLIYTPLYRQERGAAGELRQGEHYGWVYSPLRAHDLFRAIFANRDLHEIVVEVFDGAVAPDRLLFASSEPLARPRLSDVRILRNADRDWVVRISSSPGFASGSPLPVAAAVAAAGILISLLLAFLMHQQVRAASRTERKVEARTAELREANRRLVDEARAREAAEAKIAHMQKLEAIGQLTGGIAHDFNNMLTVIIGNLDGAQRRPDDLDRVGRAIRHAREAAERAAELTRRLLAFGRQQSLSPRDIRPNELIEEMRELLERSLGGSIRLEVRLAPRAWRAFADPAQLENAILNLAINARDAMPGGGTLVIETGNSRLGEDDAREGEQFEPGEYVQITVRDNGSGMSPEVLERALEPFFTTKEVGKGSGLGLSQVFGFVRQSGGHLALDSVTGEGTSASIYLPRHKGRSTTVRSGGSRAGEKMPAGKPNEVVLVVEDDERVRDISFSTLSELGYTVLQAEGGETALSILRSRDDVRLLFTDVVMPGIGGRELADEARRLFPDLKILFTSGYTRDQKVHTGGDNGLAMIEKPFAAAALARKIRDLLDS